MQHMPLLEVLCDNNYHSGEDLAANFKVSRATISNWIGQIRQSGIDIHSVPGRGYVLPNQMQPLNFANLQATLTGNFHFLLSRETNSTNEEVKQLFKQKRLEHDAVVLAATDKQTQGRGRRGRVWHSPFAQNLYFTLGMQLHLPMAELSGLSLVVGIAVAKALQTFGLTPQLKWPNDVYLEGKKLGGILIELEGNFEPPYSVIMGVGLNVNMVDNQQGIEQAWNSLALHSGHNWDRTQVLTSLIQQIINQTNIFCQQGFSPFAKIWPDFDLYLDQNVNIVSGQRVEQGINLGVDDRGNLLLNQHEQIKAITGGEVSLRPA
ncbi:biotin--acetyl-CoA-carboxylase ligase [Catenovulum agarivorans DS-2]|uniref:Bifunctional ligase/repressor BirA n=1 Tax=Catenovulum agarivorans DS-2 TaxID=1328313 RepID=W7Q5S0_9ALTE|nr:biotin--[acetyl-CoA-carboxylase] ligase [Catenovulum agarivorans]EWH08124.1 biotin--acetyl-CoA-carboxylase ligase [Catenovulum agarivorans DS-2]